MTAERIQELREAFEYEHPVCECIDEIERLRAAMSAILLESPSATIEDLARAALEKEQ